MVLSQPVAGHSGAAAAPSGVALLASSVRRHIVDHLANLPDVAPTGAPTRSQGMTAAELGQVLGLHSTTARFHLDQLVAAGLLGSHFVRRAGAGRPSKRYYVEAGRLGPVPPSGDAAYRILADLLAGALGAVGGDVTPEDAGRAWALARAWPDGEPREGPAPARTAGQWIGKIGAVIDLLGEWGYTPELSTVAGGRTVSVTVRDCPFLELARDRPEVVCGVHRGLLRGALTAVGEPDARVGLHPFVAARTCHATLSSSASFLPGGDRT